MINIDLGPKHDARARELGFSDRFQYRKAINLIASRMSVDEFDALTSEQLEELLCAEAKK